MPIAPSPSPLHLSFPPSLQVCNHPDLFEPRPTTSPLRLAALEYYTASLVLKATEYEPLKVNMHWNIWVKLQLRGQYTHTWSCDTVLGLYKATQPDSEHCKIDCANLNKSYTNESHELGRKQAPILALCMYWVWGCMVVCPLKMELCSIGTQELVECWVI